MATQADLQTKLTEKKPMTFPALIQSRIERVRSALPAHLRAESIVSTAVSAWRRSKTLQKCDPDSILASVIQAAQLGLEIDTLGRAYLIPYGTTCQFVPGWKGLIDLVNRTDAATVWTGVIFKDQKYRFVDGSTRSLEILNESDLDEPGEITHAYAIGWKKGALMPVIELWKVGKIEKHRNRYNKVGSRHYSYENWEMYARKVVLLQVLKYMPMSREVMKAIEMNDAAEIGNQNLSVDDAIEGTWTASQEATDNLGSTTATEPEKSQESTVKAQDEAFAKAMNAIDLEEYSIAESLLNDMSAKDAAIVVSKLPPKG